MSRIEESAIEYLKTLTNGKDVTSLVNEFRTRAEMGFIKYGQTLERDDLTIVQWNQHLKEELIDALNYTMKLETFGKTDLLNDLKHVLGIYLILVNEALNELKSKSKDNMLPE